MDRSQDEIVLDVSEYLGEEYKQVGISTTREKVETYIKYTEDGIAEGKMEESSIDVHYRKLVSFSPSEVISMINEGIDEDWGENMVIYACMLFVFRDKNIMLLENFVVIGKTKRYEIEEILRRESEEEILRLERKKEEKRAKEEEKKEKAEKAKEIAKEKSKSAFNPPPYPPAQKIACKGSAKMISNASAQRAWLDKWAKNAWDGQNLWSAKTAEKYVKDKKNGIETLVCVAVPLVAEIVAVDNIVFAEIVDF
jgi:hypothetical protein